jgi:hypothetical protein
MFFIGLYHNLLDIRWHFLANELPTRRALIGEFKGFFHGQAGRVLVELINVRKSILDVKLIGFLA